MSSSSSKTRKARAARATTRRRPFLLTAEPKFVIEHLDDISPFLQKDLDAHMAQCWKGKKTFTETKKIQTIFKRMALERFMPYDTRVDVMYKRGRDGKIVFSRIIERSPKTKTLHIDHTCVSESERGKGLYKESLELMKRHYRHYNKIVNKVESGKIGSIDHSTRLLIFHKLGYRFQPTVRSEYSTDDNLYFELKPKMGRRRGDVVALLSPVGDTFQYTVLIRRGIEKTINLADIKQCLRPVYVPDTIFIQLGRSVYNGYEKRRVIRMEGEMYITRNPITGKEEVISPDEINPMKTIMKRKGDDAFDIRNYETAYCPLFVHFGPETSVESVDVDTNTHTPSSSSVSTRTATPSSSSTSGYSW